MAGEEGVVRSEVYGVQILRAIAALAVVLRHTLEQSNGAVGRFSPSWLTYSGGFGVDIFFVISGFIMLYVSFPAERAPSAPGTFLYRRAVRIYPLYWLCCLGILSISGMGFLQSHEFRLGDVVRSFLLLPTEHYVIAIAWTLVYEMYFYLIFAVMLLFRSKLAAVAGTTSIVALIFSLGHLLGAGELRGFLTNPIPLEFCFGLWLAFAFISFIRSGRRWPVPPYLIPIALILMTLAPLLAMQDGEPELGRFLRVLVWGTPAVLVVAASLRMARPQSTIGRFMLLLGDASYALYLTHVFVMIGYGRLIKIDGVSTLPQIAIVPVIVAIAVAVGLAAHICIERPLNAQLRKFSLRSGARI